MPRSLRLQVENGLYHLAARGVRQLALFGDDEDRLVYLAFLANTITRYRWVVHSYCLMPNHVHLLVETPLPNVSVGVQWLHARYAQHANQRYGHQGHAFDRRFRSVLVERESHLLEAVRYIALNPVRAGLCRQPEWFPWSSFRELMGIAAPSCTSVDRVLDYFADEADLARRRLSAFVRDTSWERRTTAELFAELPAPDAA